MKLNNKELAQSPRFMRILAKYAEQLVNVSHIGLCINVLLLLIPP